MAGRARRGGVAGRVNGGGVAGRVRGGGVASRARGGGVASRARAGGEAGEGGGGDVAGRLRGAGGGVAGMAKGGVGGTTASTVAETHHLGPTLMLEELVASLVDGDLAASTLEPLATQSPDAISTNCTQCFLQKSRFTHILSPESMHKHGSEE